MSVACGNEVCRYEGRERRVHLRTAAPGVLEMPRLVCAGCGFDMPTVAPWPPINDSEDDSMPKITRHGGPSIADAEPEPEAGEDVSAGSSSSESSEREPSSPEPSETPSPSPAPTTASRSKKGRTASRSARSTDGGQEAGTSETGSADDGSDA
ncbi:hypothetical protein ACH5A2_19840 [Streptomyces collinus]|uniref:hypothetical protein n=1 Tax=Streptomyces collinus TaxID=42684 RepID=UPI0037B31C0D